MDIKAPWEYKGRKLLDETPIFVLPSLAVAIGLNESMLIQEIHWRLLSKGEEHHGRTWVRVPVAELVTRFPFLGDKTIKRTLTSLKEQKLLLSHNYNEIVFDKTLWYAIDYEYMEAVEVLHRRGQKVPIDEDTGQDDPPEGDKKSPSIAPESPLEEDKKSPSLMNNNSIGTTDSLQQQQTDDVIVDLANALFENGIRPMKLCASLARIPGAARQLEWYPLRRGEVAKWSPGVLRKSIEEDWAPPKSAAESESHTNGHTSTAPKPTAAQLDAAIAQEETRLYEALPPKLRAEVDREVEQGSDFSAVMERRFNVKASAWAILSGVK